MNKTKKTRLGFTLLMLVSALSMTACNDSDDTELNSNPSNPDSSLTDCMWQDGPNSKTNSGEDPLNFAYPDTNVSYWSSEFTVPEW